MDSVSRINPTLSSLSQGIIPPLSTTIEPLPITHAPLDKNEKILQEMCDWVANSNVHDFERGMEFIDLVVQRMMIINYFGQLHFKENDKKFYTFSIIISTIKQPSVSKSDLISATLYLSSIGNALSRVPAESRKEEYDLFDTKFTFSQIEQMCNQLIPLLKEENLFEHLHTPIKKFVDFTPLETDDQTGFPKQMDTDLIYAFNYHNEHLLTNWKILQPKLPNVFSITFFEKSAFLFLEYAKSLSKDKRTIIKKHKDFLGFCSGSLGLECLTEYYKQSIPLRDIENEYNKELNVTTNKFRKWNLYLCKHKKSFVVMQKKVAILMDQFKSYYTGLFHLTTLIERLDPIRLNKVLEELSRPHHDWMSSIEACAKREGIFEVENGSSNNIHLNNYMGEIKERSRIIQQYFLLNHYPFFPTPQTIWNTYETILTDKIDEMSASTKMPEWLGESSVKKEKKKKKKRAEVDFPLPSADFSEDKEPTPVKDVPKIKRPSSWMAKVEDKTSHAIMKLESLKFLLERGVKKDKKIQHIDNAIFHIILVKMFSKMMRNEKTSLLCANTMGMTLTHLAAEQLERAVELDRNEDDHLWNEVYIKSYHDLKTIFKYCYVDIPKGTECLEILRDNSKGSLLSRYPYSYEEPQAIQLRSLHQLYRQGLITAGNETQEVKKGKKLSEDLRYIRDLVNDGIRVAAKILKKDKTELSSLVIEIDRLIAANSFSPEQKVCLQNASFQLCMLDTLRKSSLTDDMGIKLLTFYGQAFCMPLVLEQLMLAFCPDDFIIHKEGHDLLAISRKSELNQMLKQEVNTLERLKDGITTVRYPFYSTSSLTPLGQFIKNLAVQMNDLSLDTDDEGETSVSDLSIEESKARAEMIACQHKLVFNTLSFIQLFAKKAIA